jgi:hypothetical protein
MKPDIATEHSAEHDDALLLVALPPALLLPLPKGKRSTVSKRRPGPATREQRKALGMVMAAPGRFSR